MNRKAIASTIGFIVGLTLILAAITEYAAEPMLALLGKPMVHEHRPVWQSVAYMGVGLLLAFPGSFKSAYEYAKPYIPSISLPKRGGQ